MEGSGLRGGEHVIKYLLWKYVRGGQGGRGRAVENRQNKRKSKRKGSADLADLFGASTANKIHMT